MRAWFGPAWFLPALLLCFAAAPDGKLAELTADLAHARGQGQAVQLEAEIESLRLQSVEPAARLLLRHAGRQGAAGNARGALADLDDALTLQPDNPVLWRERAHARASVGDLDGAVSDLGVALSRAADDVLAWQSLSDVEAERSAWTAATKAWQHVLSLDPQFPGGEKRLEKLRLKAFGQPM